MLQKVCRCIQALLLSALLVCMFIVPGAASGSLDASQKGSIKVDIDATGKMTLYQIASYHKDTNSFEATDLFADSGFDQDHLTADDAVAILEFIQSLADTPSALKGQTKEIQNGSVQFTELPLGVYLLVHEGSSGAPEALPFFVTIPMQQDGAYIYDVEAASKVRIPSPSPAPVSPSPSQAPPSEAPESPAPTEPAPTEPVPTEPVPTDPVPTDPVPSEPAPSPSQPSPSTPAATPTNPGTTTPPNSSADKLPNTGQLNWPIPVLVVLGLVLFGAGWYLNQTRRGDK